MVGARNGTNVKRGCDRPAARRGIQGHQVIEFEQIMTLTAKIGVFPVCINVKHISFRTAKQDIAFHCGSIKIEYIIPVFSVNLVVRSTVTKIDGIGKSRC